MKDHLVQPLISQRTFLSYTMIKIQNQTKVLISIGHRGEDLHTGEITRALWSVSGGTADKSSILLKNNSSWSFSMLTHVASVLIEHCLKNVRFESSYWFMTF